MSIGDENYQRVLDSLRRPASSSTADLIECHLRSIDAQAATISMMREIIEIKDAHIAALREQVDCHREHLDILKATIDSAVGHAKG